MAIVIGVTWVLITLWIYIILQKPRETPPAEIEQPESELSEF